MSRLAVELRRKGAALFDTGGILPALAPAQAEADAICLIQAFYALAVRLANERGVDAANPRHLNKITRTT
jgi:glucosamine--fructose-6-phosphate aminotransferase (isomerizing)